MASPLRLGLLLLPFLVVLGIWIATWFDGGPAIFGFAQKLRVIASTGFSWGFLATGLLILAAIPFCAAMLSSTRIGGPDARHALSEFDAVAVGFAATTSLGLIYWAAAEPLYNTNDPARALQLFAGSREARLIALSGAYLHWGLLAHAITGIFMVGFGVAVQTIGRAESLEGVVFGANPGRQRAAATLLDGPMILFATLTLIAGLASIAVALPSQFGEARMIFGTRLVQAGIIAAILLLVMIGGARPLATTYAAISRWALLLLFLFLIAVIFMGPTGRILGDGFRAVFWAVKHFDDILFYGFRLGTDDWAEAWTVTHLIGWMIVAPLGGFFLARAARGYTMDEAVLYFVLLPALISIVCVMVLGGLAVSVDRTTGGALWNNVQAAGAGNAIFDALSTLKQGGVLKVALLILLTLSLISFLAAALHSVIHLLAPGFADAASVIGNRRAVMMLWTLFLGITAWVTATFRLGPIVEEVARIGAIPALIVAFLVVLTALRFCLMPARSLLPRRGETVDLGRYEKEEGWSADVRDDDALRSAILKGKPKGHR